MNTQEVADKLVQLCREGKNVEAINELYADNITSYEPKGSHMEITEGKAAVMDKTNEWLEAVETIHSATTSDPIVTGNFFTISMDIDVTFKGQERTMLNEIGVYQVKDGKIVSESFHYDLPQA
jgi:limonene-1,2-epoxide hydrolase